MAPRPMIVRLCVIDSTPLLSVMVWLFRLGLKTMASPDALVVMALRSEPAGPGEGPSLVFITVKVAGARRSSRDSRHSLVHRLGCGSSRGLWPLWERRRGWTSFWIQERKVKGSFLTQGRSWAIPRSVR